MKPKYQSGKRVREEFEHMMTALFRVSKDALKKSAKKAPKKKAGKD